MSETSADSETPQGGGSAGALIAGIAVLALLGFVLAIAMIGGGADDDNNSACGGTSGAALTVAGAGNYTAIGQWDAQAVANAAQIAQIGEQRSMGINGQLIAIMAAMTESSLHNIPFGDRDSLGLFQMRPSQGWGTPEQLLDITYETNTFYDHLNQVSGWQSMDLGAAAQAVERSAFPTRYASHEADARQILTQISGSNAGTETTSAPTSNANSPTPAVGLPVPSPSVLPTSTPTSGGQGPTAPANPGATVPTDATTAAATVAACGSSASMAAAQSATNLDQLPRFTMPAGCTDKTPVWSAQQGPNTLNGNIPAEDLCTIPGTSDQAQSRAAAAFVAMDNDYFAQTGSHIGINSSYRDYNAQVGMKLSKGALAAPPGYSNHGFGLALDLNVGSQDSAVQLWIRQNGPKYGWWHPMWARPTGYKPEPWHFEYGTWLLESRYTGLDTSILTY